MPFLHTILSRYKYDKIDEVEDAIADLKSQVYELKKNQINADSIYGYLNAGIEVGENYNLPKSEDSRQPQCPEEKTKRETIRCGGTQTEWNVC